MGTKMGFPRYGSKHPWNKNQQFQEHHQEKKPEDTWNIFKSSPETVTILYMYMTYFTYKL